MKKSFLKFVAAFLAVGITSFAVAQTKPEKTDAAANLRGKVTATADGTITISSKKTGDQTVKTDASTQFLKADGSAGTAADIKVGSRVQIKPGTAGQAAVVKLIEPKAKGEAKADAPEKD